MAPPALLAGHRLPREAGSAEHRLATSGFATGTFVSEQDYTYTIDCNKISSQFLTFKAHRARCLPRLTAIIFLQQEGIEHTCAVFAEKSVLMAKW